MINTSELFNSKIAESTRQLSARLMYGTEEISGAIRSVQITSGACGEGNFTVGAVFSSYIEVIIDECEDALENKELLLQIGLLVDDEAVEYVDIGYYTVTKPKSSVYSTTFTAVGRITSKLNELFDVPSVLTLRNIADAITTATGVAIIFNGDVSDAVLAKDITGMTCKEALSVIAGTFGGFATEDNAGNIVVSKYNTASKVPVNGDRMTALPEFNDYDYDLNGIKVIVSAAGETEDGSAIEEVTFTEGTPRLTMTNEFMTAELFEKFVANTVGYKYRPGNVMLALGDPRLQPWDCLEVTDVKENVYTVPCLNIVHTFDGGLSTTITAPGESESESEAQTKGPLIQQLERLNSLLITAQDAIVKRLIADEILTDDITGATGNFTKYLTGVKILGDLIEANTLKANTLILQGDDGIYRRLNIDSLGEAKVNSDAKYNEKLDGSVLVADSVTADKINVTNLFAKAIASTGDFNLGDGALVYDNTKDTITMRAKQISAATNDGLILSDRMTSGNNVLINSEGFYIRSGETALASFDENDIYLGNETTRAALHLCGNRGVIEALTQTAGYDESWEELSLSTPHCLSLESEAYISLGTTGVDVWNGNVTNAYLRVVSAFPWRDGETPVPFIEMYCNEYGETEQSASLKLTPTGAHLDTRLQLSNNMGLYGLATDGSAKLIGCISSGDNLLIGSTDAAASHTGNTNIYAKNGNIYLHNQNTYLRWIYSGGYNYFSPNSDAEARLGSTDYRWYRLYQSHSSVSTSDKRQKENIKALKEVRKQRKKNGKTEEFDVYGELFDRLEPVEYNFIEGNKRKDFGLIAQDVLEVMLDLGLEEDELDLVHHDKWIDEETGEEKDGYGIAYENLIAVLIHEVQKLKATVKYK